MGERSDLVADLQEAFSTDLVDAVVSITVTNYDRDSYDPITGVQSKVILNQQTTRGIYTSDAVFEVYNYPHEPNEEMVLILQDELSFAPQIGAEIVSSRGTNRVLSVTQDPMRVLWECKVRS